MNTTMNYTEVCYSAAIRQMPNIPAGLLNSLPLEDAPEGSVYLHQSGGFCMVLMCRDRGLTQEGSDYFVGDSREGMEDAVYYEGPDMAAAFKALTTH